MILVPLLLCLILPLLLLHAAASAMLASGLVPLPLLLPLLVLRMLVLPTHVVLQLQLLPLLQRLRYTHVAPDQLAEKSIN